MKRFSNVLGLSLLVLFQTSLIPQVLAGEIKYKSQGDTALLTGDAKTKKVGKLKLGGDSKVVITNNVVDILFANADLTAKDPNKEDKKLTGTAFCLKTKTSGIRTKITGYTFFEKGSSITEISVPGAQDKVTLEDGTTYTGTITKVGGGELQIRTKSDSQTIRTSSIDSVSSPKVSKFEISVRPDGITSSDGSFTGSCKKIVFKSTYSGSSQAKTGAKTSSAKTKKPMTKKQKIALACVVGLIVATAIAVPLAVAIPLANRRSSSPPTFVPMAAPAMEAAPVVEEPVP